MSTLYRVFLSFFCILLVCADAPHLSLLIQNQGKNALLVTITAPGFVQLEKNKVELLGNEDTKVISVFVTVFVFFS